MLIKELTLNSFQTCLYCIYLLKLCDKSTIILETNDLTNICNEISEIRLILWMVYTCNGLFQKKSKQGERGRGGGGGWGYNFLKKTGIFYICLFILENSRENKLFPLEIRQNCVTPLGNSKVKNQNPWKFHMIFLDLRKFHFFSNWSLEFAHAPSSIPLGNSISSTLLFEFFLE